MNAFCFFNQKEYNQQAWLLIYYDGAVTTIRADKGFQQRNMSIDKTFDSFVISLRKMFASVSHFVTEDYKYQFKLIFK